MMPRSCMFFTWFTRTDASRMPTCAVIRMSSSRASPQSCLATSKFELPGARAASASVSSPSSEEKYVSLIRRMSAGCSSSLKPHQFSPVPVGMPCA